MASGVNLSHLIYTPEWQDDGESLQTQMQDVPLSRYENPVRGPSKH